MPARDYSPPDGFTLMNRFLAFSIFLNLSLRHFAIRGAASAAGAAFLFREESLM